MKSVGRARNRLGLRAASVSAFSVCALAGIALPTLADGSLPVYEFNIPPGDLGDALRTFGATADAQILFSPRLVRGRRSTAVQGRLSVNEAMDSLLANTELTFKRTSNNVILIAQAEKAPPPRAAATTTQVTDRPTPMPSESQVVEEVIVTAGKRLENIQDVPASVLVVTDVTLERANIRDFD